MNNLKQKNNNNKARAKRENFSVTDIHLPPKKKLKEVSNAFLGVKEYETKQKKYFAISWRFIFACFCILYFVTGISPWTVLKRTMGAFEKVETVKLYPSSCQMQGSSSSDLRNLLNEISVAPEADYSEFLNNNSVLYEGGDASLVCGNFDLKIENYSADEALEDEGEKSGEIHPSYEATEDEVGNLKLEINNDNTTSTEESEISNLKSEIDNATSTEENENLEIENQKSKIDDNSTTTEESEISNLQSEIDTEEDQNDEIQDQNNEGNEEEIYPSHETKENEIGNLELEIGEDTTILEDSNSKNEDQEQSFSEGSLEEEEVNDDLPSIEESEMDDATGTDHEISFWQRVKGYFKSSVAWAQELVSRNVGELSDLGEFDSAKIGISFAFLDDEITNQKSEIKDQNDDEGEEEKTDEEIRNLKLSPSEGSLEEGEINDNATSTEENENLEIENQKSKIDDNSTTTEESEISNLQSEIDTEEDQNDEIQDQNNEGNEEEIYPSHETKENEIGNLELEIGEDTTILEDSNSKNEDQEQSSSEGSLEEGEIDNSTSTSSSTNDVSLLNIFKNIIGIKSSFAQEELISEDVKIIIWYSLPDFDSSEGKRLWKELDVIRGDNVSNYTNDGYFIYDAPFLKSWDDVSELEIKFEGVVDDESVFTFYIDSIWIEADYKTETEVEKIEKRERWEKALELLSESTVMDISEDGEFRFRYKKKERHLFNGLTGLFDLGGFWSDIGIEVRLENSKGDIMDTPLNIILEEDGEFIVKLQDSLHGLGPGKYKLVFNIEDESGSEIEVLRLEEEFEWGVLAMNTNKELYLSGENAYIQMAVLDDNGHTLCDASLELRITDPLGRTFVLSDENSKIIVNPECGPDNVITKPDYYAYFQLTEIGNYTMDLEATTENGTKTISDSIEVRDELPFVLERVGPTRIYPRADYDMVMRVRVEEAYSGDFIERIPVDFDIVDQVVMIWDEYVGFMEYRGDDFYYESVEDGYEQKLIWHDLNLEKDDVVEIRYTFDAPDISPEFYLLGPIEFWGSESSEIDSSSTDENTKSLLYQEAGQWQIASDANVFRVTEYYLTDSDFTSTTYDLTLDQDLVDDYFIFVRGSRTGDGGSNPDNDYARVYQVPGGRGDLPDSGSSDVISLSRYVADYTWEGVVTVVECLADQENAGFSLLDVIETSITGTTLSGTDTSVAAWNDINQVVPFGGYHAGGAEFESAAANTMDGDVVYTRLWPSGTDTINWQRVDNGSGGLLSSTISTFLVEWGSDWMVQHAVVSGTNAGDGADEAGEYTTATISSVARDNTWVWGTGISEGDGIGDDAEGSLITLGDGVNQNSNETLVAVGAEYSFQRDFDIYVMTHPDLAVDYRFKVDGDNNSLDLAATVDEAEAGQRMALVYNGCNGSGSAHPRDRFWARYTNDSVVTVSRGYDGQDFPAWIQGVDFSNVSYYPPIPETNQNHFRWRDDSTDLNTDGGWLWSEDVNGIDDASKNTPYRLRISVANEGGVIESADREYEIQWGLKDTTCADILVWRGLDDFDDDFAMYDSDYISPNGENITSSLFVNIEGYDFVNGFGQDTTDNTVTFSAMASTTFTEIEYSFVPTDYAEPGATYCFRLYDKASSTLDNYEEYPELSMRYTNISQVTMEWGVEDNVSDDSWSTIDFTGSYVDPVFVASVQYANNIGNEVDGDADSVVVRVQNVGANSAQVILQEAGDISGSLTQNEKIHWMVAEAGTYNNSDVKMEAYTFNSSVTDYRASWIGELQTPNQTYITPVVLGQVMTNNDVDWSVFWARGSAIVDPPDSSAIYVGKNVGDDNDTTRSDETIAVIIVEAADSSMGNIAYKAFSPTGKGIDRIDDNQNNYYTFTTPFMTTPSVALVAQSGVNGTDGPHPVVYRSDALTTTYMRTTIMEDEISDTEMGGNTEDVNYLVFEEEGAYYNENKALDQMSYRFYDNADSVQPGSAMAAEEIAITDVDIGDVLRLRMGVQVGLSDLLISDKAFKLQYGQGTICSNITNWIDVDFISGSGAWRGYDNPSVIDGSTITSSLLDGGNNSLQSYEENNNSSKNKTEVSRGNIGEWDWVIENNGATYGVDYCFRMVLSNGAEMQYTHYPKLKTVAVNLDGTVYSDEGITSLLTSPIVSLSIGGSFFASTTASSVDGSFSFSGIMQPSMASSVVVYLDDSTELGVTVNRYAGAGNINNLDIYQNRVIVRHDDVGPVTDSDLNKYDNDQDSDIKFSANPLSVTDSHEFYIWPGSTFEAGTGNISLIDVDVQGGFLATGTQIISVSGDWDMGVGVFEPEFSTVNFTSSISGNTITSGINSFYELNFSGVGDWINIDIANSMATTTIQNGSLIQGAQLNFGGLEIASGANFVNSDDILVIDSTNGGGYLIDSNSTKNNLGDLYINCLNATTTLLSDIIMDNLFISSACVLASNGYEMDIDYHVDIDGNLDCSDNGEGDGTNINIGGNWLFDNDGIFNSANSQVIFDGATSSMLNSGGLDTDHAFTDITFAKSGGATTSVIVYNLMIDGNVTINSDAVFDVSASNFIVEVGGAWNNSGTFVARAGTVRFNSGAVDNSIISGGSSFYNVIFDSVTGGWVIEDDFVSENNFSLLNVGEFVATSTVVVEVQGSFSNVVENTVTDWRQSTLYLNGDSGTINSKSIDGDTYYNLQIGNTTQIRMWNSSANNYSLDKGWYDTDWQYRKKMTIDSSLVDGDLRGFPALISTTDADLAYTGSGGHMAQTTGADIFITDTDGVTPLSFEREYYDFSNGELILWVKIDVSLDTDKDFYIYYGNSGASDNSTSTGVWDMDYKGVYHLHDDLNDSSLQANDTVNNGSTDVVGKIGDGQDFDAASSQYITASDDLSQWLGGSNSTFSFWIKTTQTGSDTNWQAPGVTGIEESGGGNDIFWGWLDASGQISINAGNTDGPKSTSDINDDTWHYVSLNYNTTSGSAQVFVDGSLNATATTESPSNILAFYDFGRIDDSGGTPVYFDGQLDEIRVSNMIRSASWIQTEYNNQNDSESFISFSNEEEVSLSDVSVLGSLYSMDHAGNDGELHIWGHYYQDDRADYWSYAADFDGVNLAGSERQSRVFLNQSAKVLYNSNASLDILGDSSYPTLLSSDDGLTYYLDIAGGVLNADYYQIRNITEEGLSLHDATVVSSLNNGDFLLNHIGGSMINIDSSTIDINSAKSIDGCAFNLGGYVDAGYNISLIGNSSSYFSFENTTGDYAGEDYDNDFGGTCGGIRWSDSACSQVAQVHYRWRNDNNGETNASWKASEDTDIVSQSEKQNVRLRFSIDNTGSGSADNINYTLQFATLGDYTDCYVIPSIDFTDVPITDTGPVAMTESSRFSNTTLTTNQLTSEGTFVSGYMVENPENSTNSISLPVGSFTEVEYNFEFTYEAVRNESYCFRTVSNDGDLSSYSQIAKARMTGVIVNGFAYEDESSNEWSVCDGTTENISLAINGVLYDTVSCNSSNGVYSFSNVTLAAGDSVSIFFNENGENSDKGVSITKVANKYSNISMNVYKSRVWIDSESGAGSITNDDLGYCDSDNGAECVNVPYNITSGSIVVEAGAGLVIGSGITYIPGGIVKIASGTPSSSFGGNLSIKSGAILDIENNDLMVGGSWENLGNFVYNSPQTVTFIATSSGHTINPGSSNFENIVFDGVGGGWSFFADANLDGDLSVINGTLSGGSNILVNGGDVLGDGNINLTSGTFTVDGDGSFGGDSDWVFYNLEFGDGVWSRVSNKIGTNSIEVGGVLTISENQTLNASYADWILSGIGDVFVINGNFNYQNSMFKFSGTNGANVLSTDYYDLEVSASGAGFPTYLIDSGSLLVNNDFYIGDSLNSVTINANTNNPSINVVGNIFIATSSLFVAPTIDMNIGGSWTNRGSFSHSNGRVVFDSSSAGNLVRASSSPFYDLDFNNAAGSWIIDESLITDNNFSLSSISNLNMGDSSAQWYDNDWLYRKKITINSSLVEDDLNSFPVLVSVIDSDLSAKALSNGDDILFTNLSGIKKLDHEIESYISGTGELVAWVEVESIFATADIDIYMYYGNSGATSQENISGVWDVGFEAVWHLNESPSGTSDEIVDSTGSGYNGTTGGTMNAANSINSQIANGLDFDGIDDNIALDMYFSGLNAISTMTSCAWFRTSFVGSGYNDNWAILDFDRSEYFDFYVHGSDGSIGFSSNGGGIDDFYGNTQSLNDGNWHHTCVVYDGNDKIVYVDGNLDGSNVNAHGGSGFGSTVTRYAYIGDGSEADVFDGGGNNIYYDGDIDELSYSNVARSAEWIKTYFNNQNSPATFLNFGLEEIEDDNKYIEVEVRGVFSNQAQNSQTNWGNAILFLNGGSYIVNDKLSDGDKYSTIKTGVNSHVKFWNSSANIYDTNLGGSIYSMDHQSMDGDLYIWGDYENDGGSDYWNYAYDFDGMSLAGVERQCNVYIYDGSSVNITNGGLYILGDNVNITNITNQGAGNYGLTLNNSNINAEYYSFSGMDSRGLYLATSSTITSLDYGNFELSVDNGSLITVDSDTLNNNNFESISYCNFSLGAGISTGYNIYLLDDAGTVWLIRNHTGNLDGEDYDNDLGDPRGYIIWEDSPEFTPKSQNWRWYYDTENETPISSITSENTSPSDVAPNSDLKLRITLGETEGLEGEEVKVRLQYSAYPDFSQDVYFVGEVGSTTEAWNYADGIDNDNDLITAGLLSDSVLLGTHNESGVSTSSFVFSPSEIREWEFTIRGNNVLIGNTYYFRPYVEFFSVYDTFEKEVVIADGELYPSVSISAGAVSYSASGLSVGSSTEGVVANIDATPTHVSFGDLLPGNEVIGIHRFIINTNADSGYQLFVQQDQNLISSNGADIDGILSDNDAPSAWPTVTATSSFGYHTGDDTLSGISPSRFAADNTYAKFEDIPREISYSPLPVKNEVVDFIYRVEVSDMQEAGDYETGITYILVPTF